MMPGYKIRIFASACITRYNNGETDIDAILDSYNLYGEDRELVLAEIYSRRPDIEASNV